MGLRHLIIPFGAFRNILQIVVRSLQYRAGTGAAVHFADVAFADKCVEYGGGTAVSYSQMPLQQGR
jgi:hypothetical protein